MSSTFSSSRRHKHGVSYSHCQDRWHRPLAMKIQCALKRIDTSAVRNLREFERNSTHHNHRIPWNCTKKEQLRKAALSCGGHGTRRSQKRTNVEIPRRKSAVPFVPVVVPIFVPIFIEPFYENNYMFSKMSVE